MSSWAIVQFRAADEARRSSTMRWASCSRVGTFRSEEFFQGQQALGLGLQTGMFCRELGDGLFEEEPLEVCTEALGVCIEAFKFWSDGIRIYGEALNFFNEAVAFGNDSPAFGTDGVGFVLDAVAFPHDVIAFTYKAAFIFQRGFHGHEPIRHLIFRGFLFGYVIERCVFHTLSMCVVGRNNRPQHVKSG
jgi:hypothetical protein